MRNMSSRHVFGDAVGFGNAGSDSLASRFRVERSDMPVRARRAFGDSEGFGDAGGFDYLASASMRRRRSDVLGKPSDRLVGRHALR
jgi:hypothetical protein